MKYLLYFTVALSFGTGSGCSKDQQAGDRTSGSGPIGPVAVVPGGQVVAGFKHGRLRKEFSISGFSISKSPVTVGEFRECVSVGACQEPVFECANQGVNDDDVALCVGIENAGAYCAWSGGRLPRLNEWLLAARGRSPQRFSWGDRAPTCEQHPLARGPLSNAPLERGRTSGAAQTACGEPVELQFRTGRHRVGASMYGLEDVLLAKAELLVGHRETNFSVCTSNERKCAVYGLIPGAIDSVRELRDENVNIESQAVGSRSPIEHPYTFRCVWSEENDDVQG